MVKENIDREKPTQGGEIGNIVGLSREMGPKDKNTKLLTETDALVLRIGTGSYNDSYVDLGT